MSRRTRRGARRLLGSAGRGWVLGWVCRCGTGRLVSRRTRRGARRLLGSARRSAAWGCGGRHLAWWTACTASTHPKNTSAGPDRQARPEHDGGVRCKRPCRICRRWFLPSARQSARPGDRQRVCSGDACQQERRRRTQARWRAGNPEYFAARRLAKLPGREALMSTVAHASPSAATADPSRVSAPLDRLPWDVAQDEFGAKGAEFIAVLGRLLVKSGQDVMRG